MMNDPRLDLDLSLPPEIPEQGIKRANEIMATGKLHRYEALRLLAPSQSIFLPLV